MKTHTPVLLLILALLGVTPAVAQTDAPAAPPAAAPALPEVGTEVPETPAGDLLRWFFETTENPTEEAFEGRLGDSFNDGPTPDPATIRDSLARIHKKTEGFSLVRVLEVDDRELDALLRASNGKSWWIANLATSPAPPYTIEKLFFRPLVEAPGVGVGDWGDLTWMLGNRSMPPVVSMYAEEITPGAREDVLLQLSKDDRGAIGPASVLFTVASIAEQAGRDPAVLTEMVSLDPSLESLVSIGLKTFTKGEAYEAGELLTLALHNDLTAADQLLGWAGRGAVEKTAAEVQGDDSPNLPFMTTGEFFKLKLLDDGDTHYQRFVQAQNEDDRRAVLTELEKSPLPSFDDANAVTTPSRVLEVEWRASAAEMVALLKRVAQAMDADTSGRLREALNEVSPRNRLMGVWQFVSHVNGGEPGVLCDAYLLERIDGRRFVFAVIAEDPKKEIDYAFFSGLPGSIVTLMALEP